MFLQRQQKTYNVASVSPNYTSAFSSEFFSLISHRNTLHSFTNNFCCVETLYLLSFHVTSVCWGSSCPSACSFSRVLHRFSLPLPRRYSSGFRPLPNCPLLLLFLYRFSKSCGFPFQLRADDSQVSVSKPHLSLEFSTQILISPQAAVCAGSWWACRLSDIFL